VWQTLLAGVDDDLADTVSRTTTAVWRRLRPAERAHRTTRRRAPWVLGGAVAVAVLAGGALWPTASGVATVDPAGSPAASTPGPSASDTDRAGADPPAAAGTQPAAEGEGAPADLAQVTGALLDARIACGTTSDCTASVVADGAALPGGVIDLPAAERTVTLLDDFGDLAVLRVDANDGRRPSQMVVVLRRDQKWLLRDVSDVAQQP